MNYNLNMHYNLNLNYRGLQEGQNTIWEYLKNWREAGLK